MTRWLVGILAAGLMEAAVLAESPTATDPFLRQVAPVLIQRCVPCHNGSDRKGGLDLTQAAALRAGGDSGPAIAPRRPDDSLLWQRVRDHEMPPEDPLGEPEKLVLRTWIERGADWSGGALDPFALTTEKRAGYDWWSLQPLQPVPLPDRLTAGNGEERNAIDRFIAVKRHAAGLTPSSPADPRTLLRRLYFDLLGLPPAPDALGEWEHEPSPLAYERLVDRLLASPAYGERWARHWLDIVRFGESQGFERDKLRTNAWPFRDWVIRAWNEDLPYDEFARRQLAGDAFYPGDRDALVATGFLTAGPYDEVGQKQQSAAMRAVVRQDELEDLLGTVSQSFLGLTVNCSRCHDHKFDPVLQREYYQLTAALAGVQHGEPALPAGSRSEWQAHAVFAAEGRIRDLEQRLQTLEQPVRESLQKQWEQRREAREPPRPTASWEFAGDARDDQGPLHGELHGGARIEQGQLVLDGSGYFLSAPLDRPLFEKTLEAWVLLTDLDQRGGGVLGVQTLHGEAFDALVFGEQEPRKWMAGSNSFLRTQSFHGPEENATAAVPVHLAIVYRKDGAVAGYRNGVPYGMEYQSGGLHPFAAGNSQVVIGLRHSPPGGNRLWRGRIERARIYDRALTAGEIAASAGAGPPMVTDAAILAGLSARQQAERKSLQLELDHWRQTRTRWQDRQVYAVAPGLPGETFLLKRGNASEPGEAVVPGGIAALGPAQNFSAPVGSSDADRRRALAQWISSEHNPLFARVLVNRLWHYHFGTGLVDTPNDFGFNGGRPSHPELLDWLAGELIESGWSIKHVQQLIVTSATYRQSSQLRSEMQRLDADNRWLWRRAPQRLDAETLRDTLLATAGELNRAMFGPGYYDFTTFTRNSQFYVIHDRGGELAQRRTIYRTWVRSGRNAFLDVFDCPDPSTKTPQRAVTTTPLQALALFNNAFVLRMAEQLSRRIEREVGAETERQVERAFALCLGRGPRPEERAMSETLVSEHGLAELCRVLFNSSELLYVD